MELGRARLVATNSLTDSPSVIITTDIGGTNLRVMLSSTKGEVLRSERARFVPHNPAEFFDGVCDSIDALLGPDKDRLGGIGAAIAGIINRTRDELLYTSTLKWIAPMPLKARLESRFGVPVILENDANAAAVGEHRIGAGVGSKDMVYVTVSTGIGGGLILDNRLYRGTSGMAGEIGHMVVMPKGRLCNCGAQGHWGPHAGGRYIPGEAIRRLREGATSSLSEVSENLNAIDVELIHREAQEGDQLCLELLRMASDFLGIGIANLINIFNPELIVLGGGLTNMLDLFLNPAIQKAKEQALPPAREAVRFEVAKLGDDAGLIGVLQLLKEELGLAS